MARDSITVEQIANKSIDWSCENEGKEAADAISDAIGF